MVKLIISIALLSLGINKAMPEVRNGLSGNPIEVPAEVQTLGQLYAHALRIKISETGRSVTSLRVMIPQVLGSEVPLPQDTPLTQLPFLGIPSLSIFLHDATTTITSPEEIPLPTDNPFPPFDTLPPQWQNFLTYLFNINFRFVQDRYCWRSLNQLFSPIRRGYQHIVINDPSVVGGIRHIRGEHDIIISVPLQNDSGNSYVAVLWKDRELFVMIQELERFQKIFATHADLMPEFQVPDTDPAEPACMLR